MQSCTGIVCVAFDFARVSQRVFSRERASSCCVRESCPRNGGRSAAPQTTGHRNFVFHGKAHRRQLKSFLFGSVTHRTKDQILFGRLRQRGAANSLGASESARTGTNLHGGASREIHFEREAKTIEAGAQICR